MKILVLAPHPFFQHRGTPIAVRLLVESLVELGHEVDLLTYHEGEDVPLPGVRHFRTPRIPGVSGIRPGFSLKKLLCDAVLMVRCWRLHRRHRYDLLHAVEESAFLGALMRRLFRVPYIYDMDSSMPIQLMDKYPRLHLVRRLLTGCEAFAVRQSLGVVAVCRSLEEEALRHHPTGLVLRLEDISLLDSGVESDRLEVPRPFALYVGNLESYQGIDLLMEAMEKFIAGGSAGNLCIVGGNDRDIESYRQRCEDLGLSSRVYLVGRRPIGMLGGLLAQADILVSPRTQGNNTPMKIYSYLDAGKPILATRLPTHTQVLDDDVALLVEPDAGEMCDGLERLFGDRAYASELGERAHRLARREFTREAFHRKLAGFYEQVEGSMQEASYGGERPTPAAKAPIEKREDG